MNLSLQDVRHLGFQKIHMNYCETTKQKRLFFESMKDFNSLFSSFKVPSYSFLNMWDMVKGLDESDVGGIKSLVLSVEPLISLNEPSLPVKRKFRNTWDLLWNKFGEVTNLSISEVGVLKEVGLKIPIFLSAYELNDEKALKITKYIPLEQRYRDSLQSLCSFYNALLNWFVVTQFESNLTVRDKTLLDVLTILTVNDNSTFVDLLERGDALWDY